MTAPHVGGHAVVVGAGMAGLLAARVLVDAFDRVTVLDRDALPTHGSARKGVPQDRHPHALLEAGRTVLEELFPGFGDTLVDRGGLVLEVGTEARLFDQGGFLAAGHAHRTMYSSSRPLMEAVARQRLAEHDGIRLRGGCQLVDHLTPHGSRVRGVAVHDGESGRQEIPADLVVDATGRGTRTPAWLAEHGFAPPATDEVRIDVGYTTRVLERPDDDRRNYLVPPAAPDTRGGVLLPIESGKWLLTLVGAHGDHPPADPEGFSDFAATLPSPELAEVLADHPAATETASRYRFVAHVRHRYEDLDQLPDGLVPIGDAIASLNPVYGQGMSVAALEALELRESLADGGDDDLPRRFLARAGQVVDGAWRSAVGSDFRFPQTEGTRPPGTDLVNRYLARMVRRAHSDDHLADTFLDAMLMTAPPTTLFRPTTVWRTLRPG